MKKIKIGAFVLPLILSLTFTVNATAGTNPAGVYSFYSSPDTTKNSTYKRGNAATYAYNHATSPNTTDYNDYTNQGGDCTNFVSQCLANSNAGKLPFIGYMPFYTDSDNWYYRSKSLPTGVTYSWTGAKYFKRHWGLATDGSGESKFRAYSMIEYPTMQAAIDDWNYIYSNLYTGDIIQLVDSSNGEAHHSMIIHGYKWNSTYRVSDFLYAQHTPNKADQNLYDTLKRLARGNNPDRIAFFVIRKGA